jgi:hypothetical protein
MEPSASETTISHMNAGPNRVLNKECRKKQSVAANKLWYMSHVTCDL